MSSDLVRARNILLLTSPRVCAHLFTRMLSAQPHFKYGPAGYFFSPGSHIMKVPKDVTAGTWTEEDRRITAEERRASLESLETFVKSANDEGKAAFIQEQCYLITDLPRVFDLLGKSSDGDIPSFKSAAESSCGNDTNYVSRTNPTVIADAYMRSFQTVFLIRDPRLAIYSLVKAMKDARPGYRTDFAMYLSANLQFVRDAYAWIASEAAEKRCPEPLVVDAEDITNDSGTMQKLCDLTGLDKEKILYQWEALPEETFAKMPEGAQRFLSEISRSTGIMPLRNRAGLDVESERASWRKELGFEDAETLEHFIEEAMPHYEYLYARRLHG